MTRILLVEDNARMAMLLADLLRGAEYEVTIAPDAEGALKLLDLSHNNHTPYGIVITELITSDANGIEVLLAARRQQPPAESIVLTAFGSISTAIDALRAGAYDYLLKPCKAAELLACIAGAVEKMRSQQRQNEAIQQIGRAHSDELERNAGEPFTLLSAPPVREGTQNDHYLHEGLLCLDRLDYVAFFDNQQIALTPTEYALLYCLLGAQGRVLSYQEIVRHTHGYTTSQAEAQMLLKAHIFHLRRKIDPSYLINVRGVGYMLSSAHTREVRA